MTKQLHEDQGRARFGDGVFRTHQQQEELGQRFRDRVGARVTEKTADLGEAFFPEKFPRRQQRK